MRPLAFLLAGLLVSVLSYMHVFIKYSKALIKRGQRG